MTTRCPLNYYLNKVRNLSSAENNFNDVKLKENLLQALATHLTPTSDQQRLVFNALRSHCEGLINSISIIKSSLKTKQSFVYKYRTTKKVYSISIIAKPIDGVTQARTIDTIAQVLVRPYLTSSWEIIPTLNFVYTSGGKEFKIENGLITESAMDQVTPRYGAFLVRNIWNWGAIQRGPMRDWRRIFIEGGKRPKSLRQSSSRLFHKYSRFFKNRSRCRLGSVTNRTNQSWCWFTSTR
jgi:hypothetical protein